jgi:hypothetical protein
MKLRTTQFRCDLCGKFRNRGVTETKPDTPDTDDEEGTETSVCDVCIGEASELLGDGHDEEG